jgi:hypothetical protein
MEDLEAVLILASNSNIHINFLCGKPKDFLPTSCKFAGTPEYFPLCSCASREAKRFSVVSL